jgi:NitT/TauT family transport system substrate-binding protein
MFPGRSRPLAALAAATVLLAGALGACGGEDEPQAAAGGGDGAVEQRELSLSLLPIVAFAPVHLAIQEGFFQEEGLTVEVRDVQTGAIGVSALLSGDAQFAGVSYPTVFLARQGGAPLRIVAESERGRPGYSGFTTVRGSSVREPGDLAGKKVGVPGLNTIGPIMLTSRLQEMGVDTSEIEFVELPFPNMEAALRRGDIDATWSTEPFVTQIESGGGSVVIDVLGEEGIPEAGYVASESFARENPNTVAAFKRAVRKGAALAAREPARVAQILPTYTQTPAEVAREVTPPEFVDRNDVAKVQALADRMRATGGLERDVQVAEFMDAR